MTITDRIKKVIEYYGVSTRQFEINVGVSNAYFSNTKEPGREILLKILNAYPDISANWLLFEDGEMFKKNIEFELDFYKEENIFLKEEQKRLLRIIENLTSKDEKNVLSLESA